MTPVRLASMLCIIVLAVAMLPVAAFASGMKEGWPFPVFTLADENNKMVDIGTLIDKPTIVYFTHNSCHYCTQIIALLKRAETKFGAAKIRIIGINIMAKDGKLVKSYKKDLGFTFPMFAGARDDVLNTYKINYVPVLVFVDPGKTVTRVVGHYVHEKELHSYIKEIVK